MKEIRVGHLKSIVTIMVVFFLGQSFLAGCSKSDREKSIDSLKIVEQNVSDQELSEADKTVVVYYFHRTFRCPTCLKIEELTREIVSSRFNEELTFGQMKLEILNIDEPENKHFEGMFKLQNQSVVVTDYRNGKIRNWKNLKKIWDLYDNEDLFAEYIQSEILSFMNEIE